MGLGLDSVVDLLACKNIFLAVMYYTSLYNNWLDPLLWQGWRKSLRQEDLYVHPQRKLILRHCSENATSMYFICWLMVCTVIRNCILYVM